MTRKSVVASGLRIATQYRDRARQSSVYELENAGTLLDIHVSPRKTAEDAGEWLVEAHNSHAVDAVVVSEWGPTRAEALQAVGRTWDKTAWSRNLAPFDWEAIAKLLLNVRAI
jgi:transposase-like protein